MAEAYLKHLGGDRFEAESAGLEAGTLNPFAVAVMKEEGIDISGNQTKDAFEFAKQGKQYDYVVTVCDEGNAARCPVFPGVHKKLHWGFDDPSAFGGSKEEKLRATRKVRDQIRGAVALFIKEHPSAGSG